MRRLFWTGLLLSLAGCAAQAPSVDPDDYAFTKVEPGKEDSSSEAIFLQLSFEGELYTERSWNPEGLIEDQLLYTIGQLNGSRAVSRLDRVELSEVATTPEGDGFRVSYTASVPVAWGRRTEVPTEYTLELPRDMTYAGLTRFAETYGRDCVDWGAHDVDSGSMWYYYRPARHACEIAAGDVVEALSLIHISEPRDGLLSRMPSSA